MRLTGSRAGADPAPEDRRRRWLRARITATLRRAEWVPTNWVVNGLNDRRRGYDTAQIRAALAEMLAEGIVTREVRTEPVYHGSRVMRRFEYWRLVT